jgi:hypothetical protein
MQSFIAGMRMSQLHALHAYYCIQANFERYILSTYPEINIIVQYLDPWISRIFSVGSTLFVHPDHSGKHYVSDAC